MFTTFTAVKIFLTDDNVIKTSHESCNFHSKLFQMKPNVNLTFVLSWWCVAVFGVVVCYLRRLLYTTDFGVTGGL